MPCAPGASSCALSGAEDRIRLLLIDPGTSADITDLVAGHVRGHLGGRAEPRAVTGGFGGRNIASRAAAIAGHAALDALAERRGPQTPGTDPVREPLHRTGAMP